MIITPALSAADYPAAKAACDKARAYADAIMSANKRNWLSEDEAAHPDCVAGDSDMCGRVEQYETLANPPETLSAYLSKVDGRLCVAVWTGLPLGYATQGRSWRVDSAYGSHMSQYYAVIAGREYTGRGFGECMCINLRETAESKRRRRAAA